MGSNLFSLDGKVALVTGGSRGIGKMIAKGYLEAGAAKVYISSRKAPACIETAEELGPQCADGGLSGQGGQARHPAQQRRRGLGCGFR